MLLLEVVLVAASILSFVLAARAATREFSWSAVRPGGCAVVVMLLLEVVAVGRVTGMVAGG